VKVSCFLVPFLGVPFVCMFLMAWLTVLNFVVCDWFSVSDIMSVYFKPVKQCLFSHVHFRKSPAEKSTGRAA
jgi:hypothetical protein